MPGDAEATTDEQHEAVTRTQIALDQLRYLRENTGVCAQVSIRAGNHPYFRWSGGTYERAEPDRWGKLEVETVSGEALAPLFADNPVELMPVQEPEYSPEEPGTKKLWKSVDDYNWVAHDE